MEPANTKSRNTYKILFWILVIINIIVAVTFFLVLGTKQNLNQSSLQYSTVNDSLREKFDSSLILIDSLKTTNTNLMVKIGKPSMQDTFKLTYQEKRLLELSDSVFIVKDSIDKIRIYMNDSIPLSGLTKNEKNTYFETINFLGIIKIKLDLTLDKQRLVLLQDDREKLASIITRFDATKEKLNKLTKRLTSLTKIIKTTIGILIIAASNNLIVTPLTPKT